MLTTAVSFRIGTKGYEAGAHRLTDTFLLAHCGETGPPWAFSARLLRSEK